MLVLSTSFVGARDVVFRRQLEVTTPRLSGGDVLEVQQILLNLGYTDVGEPDSWYGPATASAVDQFQREMGIEATGRVDVLTYRLLHFDHVHLTLEARRRTSQLRDSEWAPVVSYRYDNRPEGNPGAGVGTSVHAFGPALDQITALTRWIVLDGSGYDEAALFDSDGNVVSIEQVHWGYNPRIRDIEDRTRVFSVLFEDEVIAQFDAVRGEWDIAPRSEHRRGNRSTLEQINEELARIDILRRAIESP